MSSLLNALYRLAGSLVTLAGKLAGLLSLLLIVVTVIDVLLRYFFNAGSVFVQELEWHIFSAIFLLGAAYSLQQDAHVRVDVLYSRLSPRSKGLINLCGTLFFLFPFCLSGLLVSIPFVERSYQLAERSSDPGGMPMRYLAKGLIVIGFALLLIEGFGLLLRSCTQVFYGSRVEYRK